MKIVGMRGRKDFIKGLEGVEIREAERVMERNVLRDTFVDFLTGDL